MKHCIPTEKEQREIMKKIGPARQQQQQQLLPVMWRKKNAISHSWSLDQGLDLVFKFVVSLLKV